MLYLLVHSALAGVKALASSGQTTGMLRWRMISSKNRGLRWGIHIAGAYHSPQAESKAQRNVVGQSYAGIDWHDGTNQCAGGYAGGDVAKTVRPVLASCPLWCVTSDGAKSESCVSVLFYCWRQKMKASDVIVRFVLVFKPSGTFFSHFLSGGLAWRRTIKKSEPVKEEIWSSELYGVIFPWVTYEVKWWPKPEIKFLFFLIFPKYYHLTNFFIKSST